MRSAVRISALGSAFVGCMLLSTLGFAQYFVDDGRGVLRRVEGPPDGRPTDWHVRLYRRGEATGGQNYWGSIAGKSADEVMKELESSQEFEKRFERWCACNWGVDTFMNPLGPVARPPGGEPAAKSTLGRLVDAYPRLKALHDGARQLDRILSTKETHPNPFSSVGNVLKEYADNLRDAQRKLAMLESVRARGSAAVAESASSLAEQIQRHLDSPVTSMRGVERAVGALRLAAGAGGAWEYTVAVGDRNLTGLSIRGFGSTLHWSLTQSGERFAYRERQIGKVAGRNSGASSESCSPVGRLSTDGSVRTSQECTVTVEVTSNTYDSPHARAIDTSESVDFTSGEVLSAATGFADPWGHIVSIELVQARKVNLVFENKQEMEARFAHLTRTLGLARDGDRWFTATGKEHQRAAEQTRLRAAEEARRATAEQQAREADFRHRTSVSSTNSAAGASQLGDANFPAAIASYERARDARPDLKPAHLGLIAAYAELGDRARLDEAIGRAVAEAKIDAIDLGKQRAFVKLLGRADLSGTLVRTMGVAARDYLQTTSDSVRDRDSAEAAEVNRMRSEVQKLRAEQQELERKLEPIRGYLYDDCRGGADRLLIIGTLGLSAIFSSCPEKHGDAMAYRDRINRLKENITRLDSKLGVADTQRQAVEERRSKAEAYAAEVLRREGRVQQVVAEGRPAGPTPEAQRDPGASPITSTLNLDGVVFSKRGDHIVIEMMPPEAMHSEVRTGDVVVGCGRTESRRIGEVEELRSCRIADVPTSPMLSAYFLIVRRAGREETLLLAIMRPSNSAARN